MKNRISILALITALALAFAIGSALANPKGKTANGCRYQVINGRYLYDCSMVRVASAPEHKSFPPPVENYSSVPYVKNSAPASEPKPQLLQLPLTVPKAGERTPTLHENMVEDEDEGFRSAPYFGLLLGSTSFTATTNSTVGAGVMLGTNLDEQFGLEFGYTYAEEGLSLGLAGRGPGVTTASSSDSTLNAHLLSAELQFHLTDTAASLRPYAGLGLAWKHSSLRDNEMPGSELSQSSFGPLAAIGAKLRFSEKLQGMVVFRYFLPITDSTASLATSHGNATQGLSPRLAREDDSYTQAGLRQFAAGLQYLF